MYSKVIFNVIFTRCMLSRDRKLIFAIVCHIHPHVIFQIFYHVYTFIWKLFSFCKKKKKIIIITTDCCKMKWKWWRNKYSNQGFFSLFFFMLRTRLSILKRHLYDKCINDMLTDSVLVDLNHLIKLVVINFAVLCAL